MKMSNRQLKMPQRKVEVRTLRNFYFKRTGRVVREGFEHRIN